MIQAVGIDTVEIERFRAWLSFSPATLQKIFTENEIKYCNANPLKSKERLAVRFAAKEAVYKALCSYGLENTTFLHLARFIEILHTPHGAPFVHLQHNAFLPLEFNTIKLHLSLTHTSTVATAFVILVKP